MFYCTRIYVRYTGRLTGTTGSGTTASGSFDPLLDPEVNDHTRGDGASVDGAAVCTSRLVRLAVQLDGGAVTGLAAAKVIGDAVSQRRSLFPASATERTHERISG